MQCVQSAIGPCILRLDLEARVDECALILVLRFIIIKFNCLDYFQINYFGMTMLG